MNEAQMNEAQARCEAARQLARARWGTTRVDGLVAELRDRADELGPPQVRALQDVLATVAGEKLTHEMTRGEQR